MIVPQGRPPTPPLDVREVRLGPVSEHVHFSGKLMPARTVAVTAPFDGAIATLDVLPGDLVAEGAVLMVLDTTDAMIKLREAEGAWLEARAKVLAMRNWDSAAETLAARRAVSAAEAAAEDAATKEAQTRQLLDAGIVPAQEYHDARRQRAAAVRELEGARAAVDHIRRHAASEAMQIAQLREENTRAVLEDLRLRIDRKVIAAPLTGVVQRAPRAGDPGGEDLGVGSRVSLGDTLYTVSSSDAFVVLGYVDERDVNKVSVGQSVEVQADALAGARTGRVVRLASHAEADASIARFEIMVSLDPPAEGPESLKMGMTVTASAEVYRNDAALVVPISALLTEGAGDSAILVRAGEGFVRRTVTVGRTGPDSAEIVSGLAEGEVILGTPMASSQP